MRDPFDRMVDRMDRQNRAAVTGKNSPLPMVFLLIVLLVSGFWRLPWDGWQTAVGEMVLLVFASIGVGAGWRRRIAYRRGWYEGRRAIWDSMEEASRRGLSVTEWAHGEMERDLNNSLGLSYARHLPRRKPPPADGSHEDLP